MTIFDIVGGKVVGRILRRTSEGWALSWAAQLTFTPTPLEGGRRFKIEASLAPFAPCLPGFILMHTAVRGYSIETRPWLKDLYARFVERAERGEFDLNPYSAPTTTELSQGDGTAEAEVAAVQTVSAVPTPDAAQTEKSSDA